MELNLADQKDITLIEKDIISYIEQYKEEDYGKILEKDLRVEVFEALSPMAQNILNWYTIKKESRVLEIEANFGEILGCLCKKTDNVVAIEPNIVKAKSIQKRYENNKHLELIVGKVQEIDFEEKFDYIIIHSPEKLEYAKKWVKPTGTILLITNNRFAISYFAGASFQERIYGTITENKKYLYGKKEIEELLKANNLKNYKFYYPLPNYKMPNVIFSDDYMPNGNTTKLMYNAMYEKRSVVVFDELKVLKQLTNNKMFDFFANSFLVEIKMEENMSKTPIRFISFNNNRKEKYQLATIMYNDKVEKVMINKKAEQHIKAMSLNIKKLKELGFLVIDEKIENKIVSKYIEGESLDNILAKALSDEKIEEACELIQKWYQYIKERLEKNKKSKLNENIKALPEQLEGLTILKNGYIDLVFENTFYQNEEFIFFDQEWYEDGIPLEFILYRAIKNLYAYNVEIEKIYSQNEMMQRFHLDKYIGLFENIEKYIQTNIINDKMNQLNEKSLEKLHDINKESILIEQIHDFQENDKKQNEYIYQLENDNKNKQNYIEALEQKINQFNNTKRGFFRKGEK